MNCKSSFVQSSYTVLDILIIIINYLNNSIIIIHNVTITVMYSNCYNIIITTNSTAVIKHCSIDYYNRGILYCDSNINVCEIKFNVLLICNKQISICSRNEIYIYTQHTSKHTRCSFPIVEFYGFINRYTCVLVGAHNVDLWAVKFNFHLDSTIHTTGGVWHGDMYCS